MATRCPICNGDATIVIDGNHYYEQCKRCMATGETKIIVKNGRSNISKVNYNNNIISSKTNLYKVEKEYISKEEYYSRGAY